MYEIKLSQFIGRERVKTKSALPVHWQGRGRDYNITYSYIVIITINAHCPCQYLQYYSWTLWLWHFFSPPCCWDGLASWCSMMLLTVLWLTCSSVEYLQLRWFVQFKIPVFHSMAYYTARVTVCHCAHRFLPQTNTNIHKQYCNAEWKLFETWSAIHYYHSC